MLNDSKTHPDLFISEHGAAKIRRRIPALSRFSATDIYDIITQLYRDAAEVDVVVAHPLERYAHQRLAYGCLGSRQVLVVLAPRTPGPDPSAFNVVTVLYADIEQRALFRGVLDQINRTLGGVEPRTRRVPPRGRGGAAQFVTRLIAARRKELRCPPQAIAQP